MGSLMAVVPHPRGTRLATAVIGTLLWASSVGVAAGGDVQFNTAEVAGVARDASGGVLSGVTLTATHPASGTVIEVVTDHRGRYILAGLQIGPWTVTARLSGFVEEQRRVLLVVGRHLELDFTLAVQSRSEQVTVTAAPSLLQTTTSEINDIIANRDVVQLPLNGRDFIGLARLSSTVVIPPGGTRGAALGQAGELPSVGGQRAGHNIYLLDGAKVTDELFNNLVVNPSVDSIQEFKIQKSMYPAEFGGKASALINVVTKAGTNTFRATAFEFYRNEVFDSKNYFQPADQSIPPLSRNQSGGSIGGPIVTDRTFFFASYEGTRLRRSQTEVFSVPNTSVRGGDFAGLGIICDPMTTRTAGVCVPFSGNRIPRDRIDPIAVALLEHVPLPDSGHDGQTLTAVEELALDLKQFSARLDHRLGSRDQLLVRFSAFEGSELQPFGTSTLQESLVPGFGRTLTTSARNLVASHTHVFGTSKLNEIRASWMRVSGGQRSLNRGTDFARRVGLLGVTDDRRDLGFPQISTSGLYSTMGDPTLFTTRTTEHVEMYENFSFNLGAHRWKFGGYYYHLRLRPEQPDTARGSFTYTGQFTGNAFADFLLGYPTAASAGIGRGDEDGRSTWLHLYLQDDWRARDNLTFNLGLRYEHNEHMFDVDNRLSSIDLEQARFIIASDEFGNIHPSAQALLPMIPLPFVTSAEAGWGRGLLDPSAVRLAPRAGFALSLHDSRAIVRGGYGVFLNQWAYSVQTAFARNLPFFFSKQVDVPLGQSVPTLSTADILLSDSTGTIGGSIMNHDYNVEYSQTWSGGIQYEVLPSTMLEVSYMGTWTTGADNSTVHNVPEAGPGAIQVRRPIAQLSSVSAVRFNGRSIYHGLTLKAERRLAGHWAFNVSYTLSRSKDDASGPGATQSETNLPQNVRNIFDESGEWALSSFDHRHQVVVSGLYELPIDWASSRLGAALLSRWRTNVLFTAQSGAPFTVNLGIDRANIGAGPAQRPDQLRDPNLPTSKRSPDHWFDTTAFALQAPYTFGSAPRNSVIGPGYANLDFVLAKTWAIGASQLEFRWEIFNLLNHTNFGLPNRIFGNANFGRIFSAKNPREMQFGLRLRF